MEGSGGPSTAPRGRLPPGSCAGPCRRSRHPGMRSGHQSDRGSTMQDFLDRLAEKLSHEDPSVRWETCDTIHRIGRIAEHGGGSADLHAALGGGEDSREYAVIALAQGASPVRLAAAVVPKLVEL